LLDINAFAVAVAIAAGYQEANGKQGGDCYFHRPKLPNIGYKRKVVSDKSPRQCFFAANSAVTTMCSIVGSSVVSG
jgi:hypothetical protein